MQIFKHSKTFKFSDQQISAFEQLEKYDVNISKFVRIAIKEKISKDWKIIKENKTKTKLPF